MKKLYVLCILFITFQLNAQVSIVGKVLDENMKPIPQAAVYLNNTTIGTTTNSDGQFLLSLEHGYYTLRVSHVGFETSSYNVNTLKLPDEVVFMMFEKNNQLDEVVLKNNKKSSKRAYFLKRFKQNFLGQSFTAQKARIKNKYALKFSYDEENDILEAYAVEPLVIENKGLGYKITCDLIHFESYPQGVIYLGYNRFENLDGNARKTRKWAEEREIAYMGSLRHFLTAALQQDSTAGFVVDKVKLIPNPMRPTDEDIAKAEDIIEKHGGLQRNPHENNPKIIRNLKWANEIIRKAEEMNHLTEFTLKKNIPLEEYFKLDEEEGSYVFAETLALRIKYMNEFQESAYKSPDETFNSKKHQVSRITLFEDRALVNSEGLFHNPYDVLLEGYWGFEKMADLVPLDYKPKKESPAP